MVVSVKDRGRRRPGAPPARALGVSLSSSFMPHGVVGRDRRERPGGLGRGPGPGTRAPPPRLFWPPTATLFRCYKVQTKKHRRQGQLCWRNFEKKPNLKAEKKNDMRGVFPLRVRGLRYEARSDLRPTRAGHERGTGTGAHGPRKTLSPTPSAETPCTRRPP